MDEGSRDSGTEMKLGSTDAGTVMGLGSSEAGTEIGLGSNDAGTDMDGGSSPVGTETGTGRGVENGTGRDEADADDTAAGRVVTAKPGTGAIDAPQLTGTVAVISTGEHVVCTTTVKPGGTGAGLVAAEKVGDAAGRVEPKPTVPELEGAAPNGT